MLFIIFGEHHPRSIPFPFEFLKVTVSHSCKFTFFEISFWLNHLHHTSIGLFPTDSSIVKNIKGLDITNICVSSTYIFFLDAILSIKVTSSFGAKYCISWVSSICCSLWSKNRSIWSSTISCFFKIILSRQFCFFWKSWSKCRHRASISYHSPPAVGPSIPSWILSSFSSEMFCLIFERFSWQALSTNK